MSADHPTPWRVDPCGNAAWKVHVVDARGHTVIPSVERSIANRIVEAVNEWSRLDGNFAFHQWRAGSAPGPSTAPR